MILRTYDFEVNEQFSELKARYPLLVNSSFIMDFEAGNDYFSCEVTINQVFEDIDLQIFDDKQNLVQQKIKCSPNTNLFFVKEGFYLEFKPSANLFEFGKIDEIL